VLASFSQVDSVVREMAETQHRADLAAAEMAARLEFLKGSLRELCLRRSRGQAKTLRCRFGDVEWTGRDVKVSLNAALAGAMEDKP